MIYNELWKSRDKNIWIVITGAYIACIAIRGGFMFTRRCFTSVRYCLSNDPIFVQYSINTYERTAIKIALRL
jgi:hypothetical protein